MEQEALLPSASGGGCMKQTTPSGTSQSRQLPRQRSTASWTRSQRKRGRISSRLLAFSVRSLSHDEGKSGDDDAKQYSHLAPDAHKGHHYIWTGPSTPVPTRRHVE